MPILGIDYEKCVECMECVKDCPVFLYHKNEDGKIIFEDKHKRCILCGHCIAVCPEDAILHEGMGETATFEGIEDPKNFLSYDNLFNALRSLRVIRRYKEKKVPEELVDKILDVMRYAPTGANVWSESFTVISDPEKLRNLSTSIRETIESDKRWNAMFGKTFKILEDSGMDLFFNASHLIVVHTPMPLKMNYINIGNIITYGRLAAQSLGLGTCYHGWTQLALEINAKMKRSLKASGTTACAFTLGYPDVKYHRIPPRDPKRVRKI